MFGIRLERLPEVHDRGFWRPGIVVYGPHVAVQGGERLRGESRDVVRVPQQFIILNQRVPRVTTAMGLERALVLRHEGVEVPRRLGVSILLRRDADEGDA